ncbi:NapC/NirT family cytochrome c [Polycladidibacter stylochi]|uniref:NapC/NirT family cytochrome c n=1 Tax=Polycladidibacter stylochi TaxID=1807766 RepID=UPI00083794DF|nr:NapC/NirT family cytochrome c [Pseudovibrio stylochi]
MNTKNEKPETAKKGNIIQRCWRFLRKPSATLSFGFLVGGGIIAGIIFWGGFNWTMEMTNTEEFCIGCHEMRENVYQEYKETVHYNNASGVRAVCSDCHVPKEWGHKMLRKIQASNEVLHKVLGSIDTPEKFEAKRLQLATNVWKAMKTTNSRECRNCHDMQSMDFVVQGTRAAKEHSKGFKEGKTCIDCHQGIAHSLPANAYKEYKTRITDVYHNKQ